MAFATQVLLDDHKRYVIKVTGDVAEASTLLVDVSALTIPCSQVNLERIQYDMLAGVAVELLWDATTDLRVVKMNGYAEDMDFRDIGGLPNNSGGGRTGDVMMVVTGTGSYTFVAEFTKTGLTNRG